MKNLNNYIMEKLIVNNTIQNNTYKSAYKDKKDLKNIKVSLTHGTRFSAITYSELKTVFDKMKEYKKKNKNIKKLCSNTVKSWHILAKFIAAIMLDWDDAVEEIKNMYIEKYLYSTEKDLMEFDSYIFNRLYHRSQWSKMPSIYDMSDKEFDSHLKRYFDNYNIKYDEKN